MTRLVGPALKIIVMALAAVAVGLFTYQSIRNHNYPNGNDLTSYLNSARWFFSGENPYTAEVRRFIYPQFLLLVCYPLSFLQNNFWQKALTAGIWSLVAWLAFFRTIFASWNSIDRPRSAWGWLRTNLLPLALIIFLIHPFLQDEFLNGQVNLLMLGALAAFFFALQKEKVFLAALFLSMAAALKIGPGLCLLFVLTTRQYRVIWYFVPLFLLWVVGLPYLVNDQAITYYGYFIDTVVPHVAASDFEHGFEQYSLLSTVSYAFDLHWPPLLKMFALGAVALVLAAPIVGWGRQSYRQASPRQRLAVFATLMTVIPLTFPMSEAHHLLLLTIPLILIVDYWLRHTAQVADLWRNRISLIFVIAWLLLHLGHALKPTPLRLAGLLTLYVGLLALVKSCQDDVLTEK